MDQADRSRSTNCGYINRSMAASMCFSMQRDMCLILYLRYNIEGQIYELALALALALASGISFFRSVA